MSKHSSAASETTASTQDMVPGQTTQAPVSGQTTQAPASGQTTQAPVSGQTTHEAEIVQTRVEEGKWMFLSEAAAAVGLSEKTLRRYIKGKRVTFKSRRLGKMTNSPIQVWIPADMLTATNNFADETKEIESDVIDFTSDENEPIEQVASQGLDETEEQAEDTSPINVDVHNEIERFVHTMTNQFVEKLDQQKSIITELRYELVEKDRQLKLLPDFEKELDEKIRVKSFETSALQKQVDELNAQNEALRQELHNRLPQPKPRWWKAFFLGE
jgi:hypothetical protein